MKTCNYMKYLQEFTYNMPTEIHNIILGIEMPRVYDNFEGV